jgi:hypothetical protein
VLGEGGRCGQTLCDSGAVADISTPDQEGATRILTSLSQHLQTSHGERTSRQGAGGGGGRRVRESFGGGGGIKEPGGEGGSENQEWEEEGSGNLEVQ